ncbi:hypothetical protein GXW78_06030 [Roseomonas terrae]|uniref:Uncharacterized protein n=1 Tax=Neoroseomonas terrae TaxID=424799 RepID=A0ABS5EEW9_9PROT|nr:hypothetical protein [Neoroseomonas terrae]MBR0649212.1 hypothetical protein [Neoroseomonas terrae]
MFTRRRKDIYEAIHPETRQGGVGRGGYEKGANLASFSSDTAAKTGRSERDVQRDATRGERIDEDVLTSVAGTDMDKGVVLDALAATPRDQQADRLAAMRAAPTFTLKATRFRRGIDCLGTPRPPLANRASSDRERTTGRSSS